MWPASHLAGRQKRAGCLHSIRANTLACWTGLNTFGETLDCMWCCISRLIGRQAEEAGMVHSTMANTLRCLNMAGTVAVRLWVDCGVTCGNAQVQLAGWQRRLRNLHSIKADVMIWLTGYSMTSRKTVSGTITVCRQKELVMGLHRLWSRNLFCLAGQTRDTTEAGISTTV